MDGYPSEETKRSVLNTERRNTKVCKQSIEIPPWRRYWKVCTTKYTDVYLGETLILRLRNSCPWSENHKSNGTFLGSLSQIVFVQRFITNDSFTLLTSYLTVSMLLWMEVIPFLVRRPWDLFTHLLTVGKSRQHFCIYFWYLRNTWYLPARTHSIIMRLTLLVSERPSVSLHRYTFPGILGRKSTDWQWGPFLFRRKVTDLHITPLSLGRR